MNTIEREKAIKLNARRIAKTREALDNLLKEQQELLVEAAVEDNRAYSYLAHLVGLSRGRIGQLVKAGKNV